MNNAPHLQRPDHPLLEIRDLAVSFDQSAHRHSNLPAADDKAPSGGSGLRPAGRAVDGLHLSVFPGQTLAVVGESGCGKSVTALSVLRLLPSPPARVERGQINLDLGDGPRELLTLSPRDLRRIRGGAIAMIFQEPMTSLNPVQTIGQQLIEAVRLHRPVDARRARALAAEALAEVGIDAPETRLAAYPHQFSGGMRQRVMIAMALACQPRLLLADEPTTALDVTIQAQILNLLNSLQRRRGLAIMLITHALGVVAECADVVCVMYAGRVVEYASVYDLFDHPLHPYTRGLLSCVPRAHEPVDRLVTIRELMSSSAAERAATHTAGWRAWWPDEDAPKHGSFAARSYGLHEVRPGHWLGVWRPPAMEGEPIVTPRLAWYRGRHPNIGDLSTNAQRLQ